MKEKKFWRVAPHLPVADVKQTVEWYKANLGFDEEWYYGDPVTDGGCRRDEMRLVFAASKPFTPLKNLSLILFVSNVNEVYEEVKQRGHKIIKEIQTYDYDMREFAILDCNGYMLRFSESVSL